MRGGAGGMIGTIEALAVDAVALTGKRVWDLLGQDGEQLEPDKEASGIATIVINHTVNVKVLDFLNPSRLMRPCTSI